MKIIGVYKVLYNQKYAMNTILINKNLNENNTIVLRYNMEKEFHENLWEILKVSCGNYISSELFKEVLLLFYDSNYLQPSIIAERLNGIILFNT